MRILSLQSQFESQKEKSATSDKAKRVLELMSTNPELADLFLRVTDLIDDQELIVIDANPEEDCYLKSEEVEKLLGMSRPTCNALLDGGKILGHKTEKGHRRFSKKSVLSYLQKLHAATTAKNKFYQNTGAEDWEL